MKTFYKDTSIYLKKNWKNLTSRFIIYNIGVFLFGLGIAIYMNTKVGASHLDILVFALLKTIHGTSDSGSVSHNLDQYYSQFLTFVYLIILTFAILFNILLLIRDYKITKNKQIISKYLLRIVSDIIPVFIWPYYIKLSQLYIPLDAIGELEVFFRTWIFIGGFLLYTTGFTFVVYSKMFLGPYNSVSSGLHNLTRINYALSRVIIDVILAGAGIIVVLVNGSQFGVKMDFFNNYLLFGTVFFVFISGHIIGWKLKKLTNFVEKYNKKKLEKKLQFQEVKN